MNNLQPPSKEEEGDYEALERAEEHATDREALMSAIDKLTSERDAAQYHEINGWLAVVREGASGAIDDPGYEGLTDDPIMVTLYRTIDTQLAILLAATDYYRAGTAFLTQADPFIEHGLTLARAINGATS